jgi:hypothetical protein
VSAVEYRWRYSDSLGVEVPGPKVAFDDQVKAEDWLSVNWPDLLDGGISEVTLMHADELIYGPMSLHPPEG